MMEDSFKPNDPETAEEQSGASGQEELKEWNPAVPEAVEEAAEPAAETAEEFTGEAPEAEDEPTIRAVPEVEEAVEGQEEDSEEFADVPEEAADVSEQPEPAYPGEETEIVFDEEAPAEEAVFEEPAAEEPVEAPKKKKRNKFQRIMRRLFKRIRAFFHNLAELPAKTLLILGGAAAAILVAIILLVVLIPKGNKTTAAAEATAVPESTETAEAEEETEETAEPEETPEPAINPILAMNLDGGRTYLKLNDSGECIADIQTRLIELGYMEEPDGGVTTKYGPSTRAAVKKFQYCNGLDVDGMLGAEAYELLMSDSAKSIQISNHSSDSVFQSDILKIQTRLVELGYLANTTPSKITGKFTNDTTDALKAFQTANGLTADGIAGYKTLELLYSDDAK